MIWQLISSYLFTKFSNSYKGKIFISLRIGEFAAHKMISKKLQTDFHFANPIASCERGLNEYSSKLIRQYIPKETEFETISHRPIAKSTKKITVVNDDMF